VFTAPITPAQLYSTASYQAGDLSGIGLAGQDFNGGNFADQNLTNALFDLATLTHADFNGADLSHATLHGANLRYASLTRTNLSGADFSAHCGSACSAGVGPIFTDLSSADLSYANLRNASLSGAFLSDANFTNADVRGAHFHQDQYQGGTGITLGQLYSTASYQAHDLTGISLGGNDLAGGNFAGQNLSNAAVYAANLTGADFTAADARGGFFDNLSGAFTTNLIRRDGHITGLDLSAGGLLVVRDYHGPTWDPALVIPITVDQHLAMGPGGTMRMVFDADAWDSTMSFAPGIPVTLGGTLELMFVDNVNLASQVGRTLDLFDWTGVTPTGAFAISSPYYWNLSNLYTTGQVTLTAVPEPASAAPIVTGVFVLTYYRRRKIS
jgi:uncharacterized protein YjbI with pentapeptide repeats